METQALPNAPNRLPLLALFGANAISMLGNMLANIAIPWFVLQTTGSAAQTGLTGFFAILPVVLAGLLGGTLIDRLGYKRSSILSDIASGAAVLLIPLLHFTVGLEFWQLMTLVFLGALLDAPGGTARAALMPELARMAGMPIERAVSLHQVIERGARLLGAPLAGLLIALMGTANVLWLDAASFFVSVAIIWLLVPAVAPPAREKQNGKYLDELLEGLRFIRRDAVVFTLVMIVMMTNFLDAAFSGVVLPVFVNETFGSAVNLGLIVAAGGGGAVLGGLMYGAVGHRLPRLSVFAASFVLASLEFWVFLLPLPFGAMLVGVVIAAVGSGPLNPIIRTVQYERVPAGMRGRVFGAVSAGAWVAMPLGVLLGGVLTEQLGFKALLAAIGLLYLVVTLSIAFLPAMRQINRT